MFDCGMILPSNLAKKKAKSLDIELSALIQMHCSEDWKYLSKAQIKYNQDAIERNGLVMATFNFDRELFNVTTNLKEEITTIKMVEEL
jgi:hypothetical protein